MKVCREACFVLLTRLPVPCPEPVTRQEKKISPPSKSEAVRGCTADSDETFAAAVKVTGKGKDTVPAQVSKKPRKMITLDALSPGMVKRGKKLCGRVCANVSV